METPPRRRSSVVAPKGGRFNIQECAIPTYWCGEADTPPASKDPLIRYLRAGTRSECLRIGVGVGKYGTLKSGLPPTSLQQLKYVGDAYEKKFKAAGVNNTTELLEFARTRPISEIEKLLKRVLTKSNSVVDARAYNSTLVFLFRNGVGDLPRCTRITDRS